MCSFKKAREAVLFHYADSVVDDDEFMLLYDVCHSKNPEFPYKEYADFCLEDMDEAECTAEFRFHKEEIPLLAEVLQIPEKFKCYQGTVCEGTEALCMTLRRLAYPCRYSDLIHRFDRPTPELRLQTLLLTLFTSNMHTN